MDSAVAVNPGAAGVLALVSGLWGQMILSDRFLQTLSPSEKWTLQLGVEEVPLFAVVKQTEPPKCSVY